MSNARAVLFGAIGVIAETSDIQRRAFNTAFKERGLDWHWDRDQYRALLEQAGGRERLRQLNRSKAAGLEEADILALHRRKTEIACAEIVAKKTQARPGVVETIQKARARGIKVGLITTTSMANIDAILEAVGRINKDTFDVIVSIEDVMFAKPHPESYEIGLRKLGVDPEHAIAVEDTATSLESARRAGLRAICTPGALTDQQDFSAADQILDFVDPELVLGALGKKQ